MAYTSEMLHHMGGVPVGGNFPWFRKDGHVWFVDGTLGSASNTGKSPRQALNSITNALAKAGESDTIFVFPKKMAATDTDPGSYAETFSITQPNLSLIGIGRGRTQGGLPQVKIGAGTTAMCTVSAPGVLIANMGFNGAGSTGGGIKINDDGGSTAAAFGLTIQDCHFKNCKCHATNGSLGGAIYWGSNGNGWQVHITRNTFYKCVADVVVVGTGGSVPQDVVIDYNVFSGPAASVDINIKTGGSGVNGLTIAHNVFPCFPAISSGTNAKTLDLTGSTGILAWNAFGGSSKTYGAAANNLVPTTVAICGNYQDGALIART